VIASGASPGKTNKCSTFMGATSIAPATSIIFTGGEVFQREEHLRHTRGPGGPAPLQPLALLDQWARQTSARQVRISGDIQTNGQMEQTDIWTAPSRKAPLQQCLTNKVINTGLTNWSDLSLRLVNVKAAKKQRLE